MNRCTTCTEHLYTWARLRFPGDKNTYQLIDTFQRKSFTKRVVITQAPEKRATGTGSSRCRPGPLNSEKSHPEVFAGCILLATTLPGAATTTRKRFVCLKSGEGLTPQHALHGLCSVVAGPFPEKLRSINSRTEDLQTCSVRLKELERADTLCIVHFWCLRSSGRLRFISPTKLSSKHWPTSYHERMMPLHLASPIWPPTVGGA